jgi:hypothetical protein
MSPIFDESGTVFQMEAELARGGQVFGRHLQTPKSDR